MGTRRPVGLGLAAALILSVTGAPPALAAVPVRPFTPAAMPSVPGRNATPVALPADPTAAMTMRSVPKTQWPSGVRVTGATGTASVTVLDRAATARSTVDGVVMRVSGTGAAGLSVDYSGFRDAYGGGWAGRLRLVQLPECALTSPGAKGCGPVELPSRNDLTTSTVTTTQQLSLGSAGTLVALTGGDSSSSGDFRASPLNPSATWSAGGSSGDFTWSYPLRVPPSLGGPAPQVALSYSAQGTDGKTAAGNAQPSWIAEGFDFWPGSIERTYQQCSDDGQSSTIYDLCWGGDNATLSLAGHGGELVQDSGNPNLWRPRVDDGSRVEKIGTTNWDNDGEAWLLTTQDGTRYYFGLNSLPGAPSWVDTNSVFTVPVFGDDDGEPCHLARFDISFCSQAYQWNLDYVVDPMGNTMSIWYDRETNRYARNHTDSAVIDYIRGGTVNHIEYGTRLDNNADSRFATPAPMRVDFASLDRCLTPGATCTQSNPANWPDVPWDRQCDSTTNCAGHYSATFWTAKRLSTVTTRVWGGSDYRDVERWTLNTEFKDPGDNHEKILWLASVSHAGIAPGYPAAGLPDVRFTAVAMSNRVDVNATTDPIWRFRLSSIVTESGGVLTVSYSARQCQTGGLMPVSPEANTLRCFPVIWTKPGASGPTTEYFHRYVVTAVTQADPVGGNLPVTSYYQYLDNPAWHYDDYEFMPPARRSYGQWRGYGQVRTLLGQGGTTQSQSDALYYRGMNGDPLPGNTARSVSIVDSTGTARADEPWLIGGMRERIVYTAVSPAGSGYGTGAPYMEKTIREPWWYGPTATRTRNGVTVRSYVGNTGAVTTYTARDSGPDRVMKAYSTYDGPTGRLLTVDDDGDVSTTSDDRCLRNEYAQNSTKGMTAYVARIESVAVRCGVTPDRPTQVISDLRSYFDGAGTFDKQVSAGKITKIESLGPGGTYVQQSRTVYDAYGRVVEEYDALDRRTTTVYSPATGPTTGLSSTNPLGWTSSSTVDPAWGMALSVTDPSGRVTGYGYDGLGRSTALWTPDRNRATQSASATVAYSIRNDVVSSTVTSRLNAAGTGYVSTYDLYDGLLRPRQTQVASATGTGRVIIGTRYDFRGLAWKADGPYYNAGAPGATLFTSTTDSSMPAQTVNLYDNTGRATESILMSYNVEQFRSSTRYGGDRVYSTPPPGGTATTTLTDARGQLTEVRQHNGATPTGGYDATRYTYTIAGDLATVTDPAGNVWRYTYDQMGRRTKTEDPDAGTALSTYDNAGQRIAVTDGRGVRTSTAYDALGRRTSSWLGDVGTGTKLAAWTYDTLVKGQPTSATRFYGGQAYTTAVTGYDVMDRPTGSSVTIPAAEGALAGTYTFGQTYQQDGSLATSTLPAAGGLAAETLTYGYSPLGLATTLGGASTYLVDTTYDPFGRPVELALSDGTKTLMKNFAYDTATGRTTRHLVWGETAPEVITDAHYAYDAAGNITGISDQLAQFGGVDDNQCFRYDERRRLTQAWTPTNGDCTANPTTAGLGGPAKYWLSWAYDVVGNRKSETGGSTVRTYAYPSPGTAHPHAVQSVTTTGPGAGTVGFTYDGGGNTLTKGGESYTWDAEGRMDTTGGSTYRYAADGERLIRRDTTGTTLYLPGQQIRSTTSGLSAIRYYGQHASRSTVDGLSWTATDHQGTTSISVHAGDMAVKVRRQTPFGGPRGTNPSWPTDRGYVGGTSEPSGLVHLGAREYDPGTGRFLSVDPLIDPTNPQQLQGYAYAENTPVTRSDPSGLASKASKKAKSGSQPAPAAKDKHPRGMEPGLGPQQNIYKAVIYDAGGNAVPVYVAITDACTINGPALCHNDTERLFDVEFLGVVATCVDEGGGVTPCYLAQDGAIHDLGRNKLGCADGTQADLCLPGPVRVAPNPVIRIKIDLVGKAPVYERGCPGPNSGPIAQESTGRGQVVESEVPCSETKMDCLISDILQFIDETPLAIVPFLGTGASIGQAIVDVAHEDYEGAAVNVLNVATGKIVGKVVGKPAAALVKKAGIPDRVANDIGDKVGDGIAFGGHMQCLDVPNDVKLQGFCLI